MNEQQNTKEDFWGVEPPKKDRQRLKKALRVALIVTALGTVALVGVGLVVGNSIRKQFKPMYLGLFGENPREEICVGRSAENQDAEVYGDVTSGDE